MALKTRIRKDLQSGLSVDEVVEKYSHEDADALGEAIIAVESVRWREAIKKERKILFANMKFDKFGRLLKDNPIMDEDV